MAPSIESHSDIFRFYFEKVASGQALNERESTHAFSSIMRGEVCDIKLAAFLVALKARGETVDELAGAVSALRNVMVPVTAPKDAIDIVGTGGDAKGTFNISTAASFVVAGTGAPVAKHGNRAVSSKSGSADVLEALGVNLNATPEQVTECFARAGLAFLWAPTHHPAMRFAAPVRKTLKLRTIFNLLGPLCNPAETKRQLIGTYDIHWMKPMAEVMARNNAQHVWVVNGADGMDELTTTGPTQVLELKNGTMTSFEVTPESLGIPKVNASDLTIDSSEASAAAMKDILSGKKGPLRDIVVLNAAAAIVIAGQATSLQEGKTAAEHSIDSGAAKASLSALIEASHSVTQSAPQAVA